MRSLSIAGFLALVIACTGLTARAADIPLIWKFKEGDVFYGTGVTRNEVKMKVNGTTIPRKDLMKFTDRFQVNSVKDGITTIEITSLHFERNSGMPGGAARGGNQKGATITAIFNDKFEVIKLEGYDEYLERMSGGDRAEKKVLRASLSEDSLKQQYSHIFVPLPRKAIPSGSSWTQSSTMALAGMVETNIKRKFTLESESEGIALIKETGDVTFKPAGGGASPVTISKLDLKSDEYKATYKFDTKLGRLKESKTEFKINGTMTLSHNGVEREMGMESKTTATIEFSEKNPIKEK